MAAHHELDDLLENIRREMPSRAQGAYAEAVKKVVRQQRKRRGGPGFAWAMLENSLIPPMWKQSRRRQQGEEGVIGIFALIIGLIGGAALMYLFDPDRGTQRRAALRGEVSRVAHEAEEALEHAETRARQVAGEAEASFEETAAHVRDQVSKTAGEVGKAVEDAAHQAQDNVKQAADDVGKAADHAAKQVKGAANDAGKAVDNAANQVKGTADDAKKKASDAAQDLKE